MQIVFVYKFAKILKFIRSFVPSVEVIFLHLWSQILQSLPFFELAIFSLLYLQLVHMTRISSNYKISTLNFKLITGVSLIWKPMFYNVSGLIFICIRSVMHSVRVEVIQWFPRTATLYKDYCVYASLITIILTSSYQASILIYPPHPNNFLLILHSFSFISHISFVIIILTASL